MITIQDWRQCGASEMGGLLSAESAIWRHQLGWDTTASWSPIEPARAAGALPGFVAREASGRIVGWTWFLAHKGCLQIGALIAQREHTVQALIDAIMDSAAARTTTACVCSVRGTPPRLIEALERCGLRAATYAYQIARLAPAVKPASDTGRPWQSADAPAMAELLARAYQETGFVRPFAPHGTSEEWRDYLYGLVETNGCGAFQPGVSVMVDGPERRLSAGLLASFVDRDGAHVSQVAVDPAGQGRGLGRRIVQQAMTTAALFGARRMTLLVATGNVRARSMYAKLGFVDRASFVVAGGVALEARALTAHSLPNADQPRRSTSVALATGGVSTRR